ncbi:hypothetical protein [Martelella mediterranea]|uniref:Uncharacterized protein n=1 Tax=Martelella mediterranea TaxID=293089 RepID=A0A4R3NQL3_9HYPH|nr:hypothetical protein [Martelella mediterranea]TCT37447.1 hypothetical protein EDC90_101824 [Martelella mediterranea]
MKLYAPSSSQGFALVTPAGTVLGHSYRASSDAAVESVFAGTPGLWAEKQKEGWQVLPVYARIVVPYFFPGDARQKDVVPS